MSLTALGKPYLPNHPNLHVSVAHCRGLIVAASTGAGAIGVDVEPLPVAPTSARRVCRRLFTSSESAWLDGLAEPDFAVRFAQAWTIKEAIGKALGTGVVPALQGVEVAPPGASDAQPAARHRGESNATRDAGTQGESYTQPDFDARLTLAHTRFGPPAASWSVHQVAAPGGSEQTAVAIAAAGIQVAAALQWTPDQLVAAHAARNARRR
ncbi:MAG: 4'-phosphopantetheinyl transferase family protein [Solirubrobacteraceae bacterium]